MAVEVRYNGNLGNRLFQYAIGRLLAEKLNYELIAEPIDGFSITNEMVSGIHIVSPIVLFDANYLDRKGLFSGKYEGQRIILDGYFQVYDYFRQDIATLRQWYDISDVEPLFVAGKDDLVINWRLGDFLIPNRLWRALPMSLIERAIAKRQWNKVYLVTESPNHEFPLFLSGKYNNLKVYHGSPLEDMRSVQTAHTLLISTSTFSWWAAILSNADKIYFPDLYNWSDFAVYFPGKNIPSEDLFPDNQSRFIKFPESSAERLGRNIEHLFSLDPYFKKLYFLHFKLKIHQRVPPPVLRFRRWIIGMLDSLITRRKKRQ